MKILKKIILIIVIFTIAACFGGWYIKSQKSHQLQQQMNEYLNKKYGMEFQITKKPELVGNEGFGYNAYQAKAIPKGQPELEFIVEGDRYKTDVYADDYLRVKWHNEGQKEIEKTIKDVYGSDTDFILKYEFNYNNEEDKSLSHMQALAKCNQSVAITYIIFSDEKFDKYEEAEKAYKVLKTYFMDNKINDYIFNVLFYSKDYKQDYIDPNGNSDEKHSDALHEKGKFVNFLHLFSLSDNPIKINNDDDLIKYYKY